MHSLKPSSAFLFSRSSFHFDWNHHHGNSGCPDGCCSHFRCHHMRRACQVIQDGGPPASARRSVPALRRWEKPICSLRSLFKHSASPMCWLSLLLQWLWLCNLVKLESVLPRENVITVNHWMQYKVIESSLWVLLCLYVKGWCSLFFLTNNTDVIYWTFYSMNIKHL